MQKRPRIASLIAAATVAGFIGPSALAQGVYRCGNSYSERPCEGGHAIDAADERTPAQRQQAERAASSEARLARSLEADRLQKERAAARALAAQARGRQSAQREAAWQKALEFDDAEQLPRPKVFIARVPKAAKAAKEKDKGR